MNNQLAQKNLELKDQDDLEINDNSSSNFGDQAYLKQSEAERIEIEELADELMHYTYDDLTKKYNEKILADKILNSLPTTNSNVIAYISMLKHLFILDFIPPQNVFKINGIEKDAIVEIVARAEKETKKEIEAKLKEVNETFSAPEDFSIEKYQTRAREIFNASLNIKHVIANSTAPEYMNDTAFFVRFPTEKLEERTAELKTLTEKLNREYDKLMKNLPPSESIFEDIYGFLSKTGRTQFFIQEMREEHNLGELTDIILKINTALQIANIAKSKGVGSTSTPEEVKQQIVDYLMQETHV